MRPRVNNVIINDKKLKFRELLPWMVDNKIFGLTVSINNDKTLTYHCIAMFRSNKEKPKDIFIVTSQVSHMILRCYTTSKEYKSINEFMGDFCTTKN